MARPSTVVPRILQALTLFVEQGVRLPSTSERKVNVLQLCRDLKQLGESVSENDAQHFHTKEELKDFVNVLAVEQGLLPIGHRAPVADAEELERRAQQAIKQGKQDAQAAVEAAAAHAALLEELNQVRAELEESKLEVTALKERLRLIEEGGVLIPITPTPKRAPQ